MSWTAVFPIVVCFIALQSIVRDIAKLIVWLSRRAGREERAASLAQVKKLAAGIYDDDKFDKKLAVELKREEDKLVRLKAEDHYRRQ